MTTQILFGISLKRKLNYKINYMIIIEYTGEERI